MESQKTPLGIKETDEVVTLIITAAKGVKASMADGKLDAADLPQIVPVLMAAGPALDGIKDVPAELWDLDGEEGAKVVGRVAVELAIENAHAKKLVILGLQALVANYALVKEAVSPSA